MMNERISSFTSEKHTGIRDLAAAKGLLFDAEFTGRKLFGYVLEAQFLPRERSECVSRRSDLALCDSKSPALFRRVISFAEPGASNCEAA
ncbi:hypothetical protein MJD09_07630 [bacterium]|nr:hypothetical protein [bacterium]